MKAAVLMAALSLTGCATRPQPSGPAPKVQVPCPDPSPLEVPQAANSPQLEEALYTAYKDLLAQYLACQLQTSPKP